MGPQGTADDVGNGDILATDHKENSCYKIQIVPWVQQDNIQIDNVSADRSSFSDKQEKEYLLFKENFLRCLNSTSSNNKCITYDSKVLTERKNFVKNYLQKHQLVVSEDENGKLLVQDLVTLSPPYTTLNCEGTNQIVLDRVSHLIDQIDLKD